MTAEQLRRYIAAVQDKPDLVKKEELIERLAEAANRLEELVQRNNQLQNEISALTLDVAFLDKRIG